MSETSAEAARRAHALGFFDDAEVSFVHACAPIVRQMMTYAGIAAERVNEEAEREFQNTRRDVSRFIQELGLDNTSARIVEGFGAAAIAGVVDQAKPDLLVIGTRGLSGVKRLVLGSVAQELMSGLEIDILAVSPSTSRP